MARDDAYAVPAFYLHVNRSPLGATRRKDAEYLNPRFPWRATDQMKGISPTLTRPICPPMSRFYSRRSNQAPYSGASKASELGGPLQS